MAEINAALVMKLRGMTGAGMMECKKALAEAKGDLNKAVDVLRKAGTVTAGKIAAREAREGVIAQYIAPDGRAGVLVEVNCQTDFVARNEMFRAFADEVAKRLAADPRPTWNRSVKRRWPRFGRTSRFLATRGWRWPATEWSPLTFTRAPRLACWSKSARARRAPWPNDEFKQLVKDITLQIAAGHPYVVSREQVPADVLAKEKEIAAEQFKNKPPQAIAKIVEGKLEKFYQTYCLVDQGFVKKNSEISVKDHVASVAKQLGDEVTIRRFVRFQVGEAATA